MQKNTFAISYLQRWFSGAHYQLSPVTQTDQSAISVNYHTARAQSTARASSRPEHPDARHPCEVCGRKFTEACSMRKHLSTVHGVGDVKTFQCNICSKIFKRNDALKRHLCTVHGLGDVSAFQCQLCAKVCLEKSNLKQHIAYVHGVGGNTFYCDVCNNVFKKKSHLKRHMSTVHGYLDSSF